MKRLLSKLKGLWRQEPVLVGTLVPLLATVGVITTDQASTLTNVIGGVASAVATLAVALKIRSKVRPMTLKNELTHLAGVLAGAAQRLAVLKTAAEGAQAANTTLTTATNATHRAPKLTATPPPVTPPADPPAPPAPPSP